MTDLFCNSSLFQYRSVVAGAALLLVGAGASPGGSARAQEPPPFPGDIGPGSLPTTRAAAAAATTGENTISTAPQIRLGGFGFPTSAPAPELSEPTRRWTVMPSIGVQLMGTDNVFQSVTDRRSDLITTISPALMAAADTARFKGVMSYAPNIQLYANTSGQNRVDHQFNGQGLLVVVPELVFFDVRGSSSIQSLTSGFAPESTALTSRGNTIQTTSLQASPYIIHRFGDMVTVQAGYGYQYVDQATGGGNNQPAGSTINGVPTFIGQHFQAHEFYAVARTGPELGRLAFEGRLINTEYIGTGVLDGAYRRSASVETRYAIIRGVSALVEGGYEQQRYAGTPGVRIDGPIWAVGARIDFSAESFLIAKYGRRDGFDSATVRASLALGGRTSLSANYEERLSTSAQRAGDLLSTTTLDELGNPIDLATGLPAVRPFSSSFLGVQSSLMRMRIGSAAIVQRWPRDTIALGLTYQEQTPISVAPGTVGFQQRGTSGSITWAHELTERTFATAYVQYGTFDGGQGDGDVVSASLTFSHQLQPRLYGSLQLATYSRRNGQTSNVIDQRINGRANQNIVLLALRQTF